MIIWAISALMLCLLLTHYALYTTPIAPLVITWRDKVHIANTTMVRISIHTSLTACTLYIYSQLGYINQIEDYYNAKQHDISINYLVETITDLTSLTKNIEQRIKSNPSDYHAKYLLSRLYSRQHQLSRAQSLLQEVVQAAPYNLTYSTALLEMEFARMHILSDRSIDIAKHHLAQHCDNQILSMLTISLFKKQRYYEARRYVKKLQGHLPNNSDEKHAAEKLGKKIQRKIASLPVEAPN